MFFFGVLHSLVQIPKDIYNIGINDCHKSISVPLASESLNTFVVKYSKFDLVSTTIFRRLNTSCPSMTNEFKEKLNQVINPYIDEQIWESPRTFVVLINGFDLKKGKSEFITLKFSNEGKSSSVFGTGIQLLIQVNEADAQYNNTYYSYTSFELENDEITNVATSATTNDLSFEILAAIAPAIAPFYFGSVLMSDNFFVAPSIEYVSKFIDKYCSALNYIDLEEAADAITSYLLNKAVDFDSIAKRVLKTCLTTPTPSPAPTPLPTPVPIDPSTEPIDPETEQTTEKKDESTDSKKNPWKDLVHKWHLRNGPERHHRVHRRRQHRH